MLIDLGFIGEKSAEDFTLEGKLLALILKDED